MRPTILLALALVAGCRGDLPTLDPGDATDCTSGGWKQVDATQYYTCGVRCDGELYCWGVDVEDRDYGTGDGKADYGQVRFAPVDGEYVSVSTEYYWASALTTAGEVVSWGRDGTGAGYGYPEWPDVQLTALTTSGSSICGLTADGSVHCGQSTMVGATPAPEGDTFSAIGGGSYYFCAIADDGGIECWGYSGDDGRHTVPEGDYAYVTADDFTCGLTVHGDVRCSGTEDYLPDSAKEGLWVHAAIGDIVSCAVGWPEGDLDCWIDFGDSYLSSYAYEMAQPPAGSFRQVSVGPDHACAITVDGEMKCWGANFYGQADPPL